MIVWEQAKRTARNERIVDASNAVNAQLSGIEDFLSGAAGLVRSSSPITAAKWQTYMSTFGAEQKYSNVLGYGFSRLINTSELDSFYQLMASEGLSGFTVYPETTQAKRSIIAYLEPQSVVNATARGFDMFSEPKRRAAQTAASETGEATISAAVQLVQDADNLNPGLLIYSPVYIDQNGPKNLDNTLGYTYVPIRASEFFSKIKRDLGTNDFAVKIIDITGGEPVEIYRSDTYDEIAKKGAVTRTTTNLEQQGATWNAEFVFDDAAVTSRSEEDRPKLIAGVGIFSILLLTTIVWLLLRAKNYDLAMQKEHEVNRAKDSLLSIASHQLRTPATGVKQYLGIVLQGFTGDITPAQQSMLEKAYSSNERQLRTINEVLHLAKLESGRIVLAKSSVDLARLIQDLVLELGSEVVEHNHKLRTIGLGKPVIVQADEHMLRMAIENLLTNAIKYTPNGGKLIIRLKKSRHFVDIEVKDNGVGVPVEERHKLYKQFVRIQNRLSRQVDGTGIGLYLARQLVELHGGEITLESAINKGSTFTITIPKGKK